MEWPNRVLESPHPYQDRGKPRYRQVPAHVVQVDRAGVLKPEPEPAEAKPGNGKAKDKDKPAELKRKYMGGGIATEY